MASFRSFSSPSRERYIVKVRFPTDDGGAEHIWLDDVTYTGGQFTGRLTEAAYEVKHLKKGQRVTVKRDDVSDWAVFEKDGMRGGYTDKVLLKRQQKPGQ
jgi:uncharacterized protein YegJ (DUF2314 family)